MWTHPRQANYKAEMLPPLPGALYWSGASLCRKEEMAALCLEAWGEHSSLKRAKV